MALRVMNSATRMANPAGAARSVTSAQRPRSVPSLRGPILQRKCACGGGASAPSVSSEECATKKLGLQTLALGRPGRCL
jgi:hypothetical protein